MRARARAARLLAAALLLCVMGCNSLGGSRLFGERRAKPSIRIEVTNLNFNDATLHALRNGERHRLGTVSGKANAVYNLEWRISMPLQIEVDLLASGKCVTYPLTVDPGDQIVLQIEIDLRRMSDCNRVS